MSRKMLFISVVLITLFLLTGCRRESGLANPASVYCEENGGELEIREDESGGQVGYCVFQDGSECEKWAYYRGECQPGGD